MPQERGATRDRFLRRIEPVPFSGCWVWTGSAKSDGYGMFSNRGTWHAAHRLAWILTHGPIPEGLCVCHKCDTPSCIRPSHLFLGTRGDNNRDRDAKGRTNTMAQLSMCWDAQRRKTRCTHGHPLSGANLYRNPKTGKRECKECRRNNVRRWRARLEERKNA